LRIVDGLVRVFMITQSVGVVEINVAGHHVSLTSTQAGFMARSPAASS
jgi:hypothetical protein